MYLNHFLKRRNKNWLKTISTVFLILAIREMLIKTALRFLISQQQRSIKPWTTSGRNGETIMQCWRDSQLVQSLWKVMGIILTKLNKHKSTIGPGISLLSTSPKYLTFCFPDICSQPCSLLLCPHSQEISFNWGKGNENVAYARKGTLFNCKGK